jgi:hypothetical protein
MTSNSRNNMQTDTTGSGGDPFARKPFQFTLRTLFLVTFVVALFCSAMATFEGIAMLLAIAAIIWAVVGVIHCKLRTSLMIVFAHLCGPAYAALIVWAVMASRGQHIWIGAWNPRDIWEVTIAVGLLASTVTSAGIAWANRAKTQT